MIVSHKNKFIFLKTRKTASGACELVLGRLCGPEDIIRPTGDKESSTAEGLKEINNRRKIPSCKRFLGGIYIDVKKNKFPSFNKAYKRSFRLITSVHAEANAIRKELDKETWNSYYKFCFERNPFDRLVSFYHWRTKRMNPKPPFKDFALAVIRNNKRDIKKYKAEKFSNRPFYEINGKFAVDKVCKFEDLRGELQEVSDHLGLDWDGWLPHTKGNFRPKKDYREYYDKDLRRQCEEAFAYEMEMFGYEF